MVPNATRLRWPIVSFVLTTGNETRGTASTLPVTIARLRHHFPDTPISRTDHGSSTILHPSTRKSTSRILITIHFRRIRFTVTRSSRVTDEEVSMSIV